MAFQTYALYPTMTVQENWEFPLRAVKQPEHVIRKRVKEVTELLDMGPLLNRYPRELSGGQQQRVALGRALVRRPQALLLDEPLGNLDARLRVALRASLKKRQLELGLTTVYVTHDQVEAQAVGDKIVVMDVGSVQQVGSPEEIYERPANLFVAGFIGAPRMNFLEGAFKKEERALLVQGRPLALPAGQSQRLSAEAGGREVVVGVRPETLRLGQDPAPQSIPGLVYVIEPQNNELIIEVELEGGPQVKVRADRDGLGFEPGLNQPVFVRLDPEAVHLFDRATGRRIN